MNEPRTEIFEGVIRVRVRAHGKMDASNTIRIALLSSAIGLLDYEISDFQVVQLRGAEEPI